MPAILRNQSRQAPVIADNTGSNITGSGLRRGSKTLKGSDGEMESYPVKAVVIAKEKRHDPVKHYVSVL